jgi:transcriptional regulator with XRE-family HTH domain
MTPKDRLGRALRSVRTRMGLTLAEVAERTGVAVSTLSKIENGQLSPTYDKLVQLSEGLELDISTFFVGVDDSALPPERLVTARRSICRDDAGLMIETENYDYRYLCTDLAQKAMVPILITIRARSLVEFSALSRHSGEEFLYILRGPVEVHTEHYAPETLQAGDAMYLDSTMGHAFLTTGAGSAQMINVCHSPQTGLFKTLLAMAEQGGGRAEPGQAAPTSAAGPQRRLRAAGKG